jgi:hypothetical protein
MERNACAEAHKAARKVWDRYNRWRVNNGLKVLPSKMTLKDGKWKVK